MSFLGNLLGFGRDPKDDLRPLWHRTVEIARAPRWYAECRVADNLEGRFDMITAILAIVLIRLEQDEELVAASARLTELFVDDMDGQLRQSGVGDVGISKQVGRLVSVVGGRVGVYRKSIDQEGSAFAEAVDRNMTFAQGGDPAEVAAGLRRMHEVLRNTDADALLRGEWST